MSDVEFLRIFGEPLTALWTLEQDVFQVQNPLTVQRTDEGVYAIWKKKENQFNWNSVII